MLLYQGHAQVVEADSGSFQTMTFDQWYSFSRGYEGEDVVSTISFKIRVPKVILLLFFDRMPKKESEVHPSQHLRARPQYLPVLW